MDINLITETIDLVGLKPLAKACDVSYQAILKWEKRGRLPRTEWTGETNYSEIIERVTGGRVTRRALLKVRQVA